MRLVCGVAAAILLVGLAGCQERKAAEDTRTLGKALGRQRPPASLGQFVTPREWKNIRQFYGARGVRPIWTANRRLTPLYSELLAVLERAGDDALDPADYDTAWLRARSEEVKGTFRSRAFGDMSASLSVELRATAAALHFAHDLALGRFDPRSDQWLTTNGDIRPGDILLRSVDEERLQGIAARLRPPHEAYTALLAARREYVALVAQGGWRTVPGGLTIRPRQHAAAIPFVRKRLAATGDLERAIATTSTVLDADVAQALRRFQARHGLPPTGALDASTRRELNVSAAERLRQIEVNLERWRLAPRELGPRHIRVNIPEYYLGLIDHGRTELGMRVIVGDADHPTPVLTDAMTHIVLNPYWNIPDSIANDEMVPALIGDPGYLARNNIELVRVLHGRAEPVDAASQDWSVPLDGSLRLRQKPGSRNALGLVKFVFPNHASVYLHDTPADTLFNRAIRGFSHGCVRVERPVQLALALLQPDGWNLERVVAAMHGESEEWVRLNTAVPVHLVYATAWVDPSRLVQFRPDIYGHDRRQRAALDDHRRWRAGT